MADNTLVHALIGALVAVVLSFVPFSPILGGGVAGYLHETDGLRVGAIAGAIAALPLALVLLVIGSFFFLVPVSGPMEPGMGPGMGASVGMGLPGGVFVLALFVVLLSALYSVALSALGGVAGAYLATEL